MRKKYFFLIITLAVFLLSIVNIATATAPTDYVSYYDFNTGSGSTLYDQNETNNNDGTISGMTWSTDYLTYGTSGDGSPYSGSFDGVDDYVIVSDNDDLSFTDEKFTISLWFKSTSSSGSVIITKRSNNINGEYYLEYGTSTIKFRIYDGGIKYDYDEVVITGTFNNGNWNHIVFTADGSELKAYLNSNNEDTTSITSAMGNDNSELYIGRYGGDSLYFNGNIDDVVIYDRALSSSEIEDLYNYGFTEISSDNFTVTAKDKWDDTDVNNITVTINGTTYTNTTGNTVTTDILTNSTTLYDITVEANDYFTENYNNYNVSSNLNAELAQNKITFQTKEIITNNTLSGVNYTIDGQTLTEFPLSNGTYNVTASKDTYYSITQEFNVSILEEKIITLEGMYNNIINLSITDTEGADINTTWSNVVFGSGDVINGSAVIESLQGNNFTLFLGGGDYFIENVSAVTDSNYTLIEKSLFSKNQLYINFKQLSDQTTITDQVNYTIKSDDIEYSGSTTSGSVNLEAIDGNYLITAESSSYEDSTYILDIPSSPSEQNISIYMRSNEGLTPIQFLVIDNFDDEVENAIVNVQRLINGTSYSIGQKYTDFTGSTIFNLDQELEYIIIASKSGYDTFTGTVTPSSTSYTLRINEQGAEPQESIFENVYFDTGYSYDNTTINFTLFVTSSNSGLQQYSVETVYDGSNYREQVLDSPSGGLVTLSFSFNSSVQSEFDVDYSFTYNNQIYSWTENYVVVDIDKYETDFSDMTTKTKVVVATIVMLLMIAIGMAVGGVIGSYVGGIIGLGVLTFTSILSVGGGIVGLTIVIILISIMNRDGDII